MDRSEMLRLALEAGFSDTDETGVWVTDGYWDEAFERFAALVAAHEREACVELCKAEALIDSPTKFEVAAVDKCARAIRARSNR